MFVGGGGVTHMAACFQAPGLENAHGYSPVVLENLQRARFVDDEALEAEVIEVQLLTNQAQRAKLRLKMAKDSTFMHCGQIPESQNQSTDQTVVE